MPINRRNFLMGAGALGLSSLTVDSGEAAGPRPKDASAYFGPMIEDNGIVFPSTNFTKINVRWRRQFVPYTSREPQGTVVVDASNHFLYVIFENQTALRYGVGVGRDGFRWYGRARIDRKQLWPRWTPPPAMRARNPDLPEFMKGGKDNPLGPRAMYLFHYVSAGTPNAVTLASLDHFRDRLGRWQAFYQNAAGNLEQRVWTH